MQEEDSILFELPQATNDWMYGHLQAPNAFVFRRDGRLWILPVTGGMLDVDERELNGDIAPFAD